MFTNNYMIFKKNMFLGDKTEKLTGIDGTKFSISSDATKYLLDSDIGYCLKTAKCGSITVYGSSRASGVYFGRGSTPPTKNDLTLESIITSGLKITNPTAAAILNEGNGKYSCVANYVIENTSTNDITINEIGVVSGVPESSSSYRSTLFERTVLSSPITIAPGQAKIVTYRIVFNQTEAT